MCLHGLGVLAPTHTVLRFFYKIFGDCLDKRTIVNAAVASPSPAVTEYGGNGKIFLLIVLGLFPKNDAGDLLELLSGYA